MIYIPEDSTSYIELKTAESVFTSNHVDLNSKLHIYSCLVLSRLTYGAAESWGPRAPRLPNWRPSTMPACAA